MVQLREIGSLWLLLTGGEVLLRPDFKKIYLAAKENGFLVSVFTNATLVTDDIVELFVAYPPFVTEVTMYGAVRETYEKVTRVPGSYANYMTGVRKLLDAGVPVKLKTMALTLNRHEIKMMAAQAQAMGCHFRFDPLVQKRLDDAKHTFPEKIRLSPREVVALEMEFPERVAEHREYCQRTAGMARSSEYLVPCGAGKYSLHINPAGRVFPCSMLLGMGISLKDKKLSDIWCDFVELGRKKKEFTLECDSCTLTSLCSQCPGWSWLEYGAYSPEVAYLCNIARHREKTFPFTPTKGNP